MDNMKNEFLIEFVISATNPKQMSLPQWLFFCYIKKAEIRRSSVSAIISKWSGIKTELLPKPFLSWLPEHKTGCQ
jgi:hypothetical protein